MEEVTWKLELSGKNLEIGDRWQSHSSVNNSEFNFFFNLKKNAVYVVNFDLKNENVR